MMMITYITNIHDLHCLVARADSVVLTSQKSSKVSVATSLRIEELHYCKTFVMPTLRYSIFRQQNTT